MKIKVSTCLIVKNEEQFLNTCLESVKNFSDEIILVDTGSTDNTIEIAKKYTDKIFYYKWDNDFSKARNYSISKAKNNWVFIIDGDEYISSLEMQDKIIYFLNNFKDDDINVYSFKIINPYQNEQEPEIFYRDVLIKKTSDICFIKTVHEYITGNDIKKKALNIEIINNKNFRSKEKRKEKLENYLELISKERKNYINRYDEVHYKKHYEWNKKELNLL
jgi:glycosyltransferase involved in cell wall biosynthesis